MISKSEPTLSEQVDELLSERPELVWAKYKVLDLSPLRRRIEDATELDLVQFLLSRKGEC